MYICINDAKGLLNLLSLPHCVSTFVVQLCYVSSEEYGRILIQGEENMKRVEADGRVVAVLEKRSINAHREGYFIVQVYIHTYTVCCVEDLNPYRLSCPGRSSLRIESCRGLNLT